MVTRAQLLELGLSPAAIVHRLTRGRLHAVQRGVYAVGRPDLTLHGQWMAAVLSCGPDAALSHATAAACWGIRVRPVRKIDVVLPEPRRARRRGIVVHRRRTLTSADLTHRFGIRITNPICTLIDLATMLTPPQLEAAINQADKLDLTDPETLRRALDAGARRQGVRALRRLLERQTFTLTDSELERRFLLLLRRAGLPRPQTGRLMNGFKVDFYWPHLGLVVETDGLRYHRTATQQSRDRLRDQAHAVAGLQCLRFTHAQVAFEPRHVEATLVAVARQLELRMGKTP